MGDGCHQSGPRRGGRAVDPRGTGTDRAASGGLHLLGCALVAAGPSGQAVAPLEKAVRALQDPAIETRLAVACG